MYFSSKKIKTLDHQQKLIEFLNIKCKDQHGIILYHQMGTGKTLSALFYIQATMNNNVLVCPEELLVVWENELKKLHLSMGVFKHIITYSNINKILNIDISDCTLIMDEAHNIINTLNEDKLLGKSIVGKLQKVKRCILLTGTPVYNNESDILYLFNIAAGKNIVPYQESKFKQEFFKVKVLDAGVKGWGLKLLSNNFFGDIISNLGMVNVSINIVNLLFGKEIVPRVISKIITNSQQKIQNPLLKNIYLPAAKQLMKIFNVGKLQREMANKVLPSFSLQITTMLMGLISVITKTYDKYNIEDFYTLDKNKFKKISSYISHYSIEKESPFFPSASHFKKYVNYSQYQISVWVQLLLGEFTSVVNDDDDDLFENISNENQYISTGRIIGNLTDNNKNVCSKFIEIAKIIKNEQSVVYSNFYKKGSVAFGLYLDNIEIKYGIITPTQKSEDKQKILDDFYKKKIQVIILHPKMTEGISILGARQLHILEPLINKADNDQLIGRVIRYQSHSHLPLSERNVKIYTWISVANNFLSLLNKKLELLKRWNQNYKAIPPIYLNTKYNKDITPDMIVANRGSKLNNFIDIIKVNSKLIPELCGN